MKISLLFNDDDTAQLILTPENNAAEKACLDMLNAMTVVERRAASIASLTSARTLKAFC